MAATQKTLTPTNEVISIPAFTDKPDYRLPIDSTGKLADAINVVNGKIRCLDNACYSLSEVKTHLLTIANELAINEVQNVSFWVGGTSDPFAIGANYTGMMRIAFKESHTIFSCTLAGSNGDAIVVGYDSNNGGTWNIEKLASNSDLTSLSDQIGKLRCKSVTGVTSVQLQTENGWGSIVIIGYDGIAIVSGQGSSTPVIGSLSGTIASGLTASISGNIVTISGLNQSGHYIMLATEYFNFAS